MIMTIATTYVFSLKWSLPPKNSKSARPLLFANIENFPVIFENLIQKWCK